MALKKYHRLHLRNLLSGTVELGPNVALAEPAIQQALVQAIPKGFRIAVDDTWASD